MSLIDNLKNMVPVFTRSRLQEDLSSSTNIYKTMLMPSLELFAKEFKGAPKSELGKQLVSELAISVRVQPANFAQDLLKIVKKFENLYSDASSLLTSEFEERIVPASMSLRAANIFRVINVLDFINSYTLVMLNAIVHEELTARGGGMSYISDVTPGAIKGLKEKMLDYRQLVAAMAEVKSLKDTIESIPDVSADAKDVIHALGASVDPMNLLTAGKGFRGASIYFFSMMVAEAQFNKYKANEQRKRALEKRLMALSRLQKGTPSAQIEQELVVVTSEIARLDEAMRDFERSAR